MHTREAANAPFYSEKESSPDFDLWLDYFSEKARTVLENIFLSIDEESYKEFNAGVLRRHGNQWDFQNYYGDDIFRARINEYGSIIINFENEKIEYDFVEEQLKILTKETKNIEIFGGNTLKIEVISATIPGIGVTVIVNTNYKSQLPLFTIGEKSIYKSQGTAQIAFNNLGEHVKSTNEFNKKLKFIQLGNTDTEILDDNKEKNICIYYKLENKTLFLTIRGQDFEIDLQSHLEKELEYYIENVQKCIGAEIQSK